MYKKNKKNNLEVIDCLPDFFIAQLSQLDTVIEVY